MAVEDLVQLFVDRDTLAKMSEEKTDNILDDVEEEVQEVDPKEESKDAKPTLDDTVQKLIGKAGNHMESTLPRAARWRNLPPRVPRHVQVVLHH